MPERQFMFESANFDFVTAASDVTTIFRTASKGLEMGVNNDRLKLIKKKQSWDFFS